MLIILLHPNVKCLQSEKCWTLNLMRTSINIEHEARACTSLKSGLLALERPVLYLNESRTLPERKSYLRASDQRIMMGMSKYTNTLWYDAIQSKTTHCSSNDLNTICRLQLLHRNHTPPSHLTGTERVHAGFPCLYQLKKNTPCHWCKGGIKYKISRLQCEHCRREEKRLSPPFCWCW